MVKLIGGLGGGGLPCGRCQQFESAYLQLNTKGNAFWWRPNTVDPDILDHKEFTFSIDSCTLG